MNAYGDRYLTDLCPAQPGIRRLRAALLEEQLPRGATVVPTIAMTSTITVARWPLPPGRPGIVPTRTTASAAGPVGFSVPSTNPNRSRSSKYRNPCTSSCSSTQPLRRVLLALLEVRDRLDAARGDPEALRRVVERVLRPDPGAFAEDRPEFLFVRDP
jgi:hypothetical protein